MSPPAALVRPSRPTTVTVAFWLQLTAVLLLLGLVGLVVAEAVHFDGQISRAARLVPDADPAEVRGERQGNIATTLILGVPALLLAGWLAAAAGPVRRGGNIARILVYVAGGAQLLIYLGQCCSGAFIVPLLLTAGDPQDGYAAEPPPGPDGDWQESDFIKTLYSGTDPFSEVLFPVVGLSMLTVLALTAAVVLLLALPPANRYFVPRAETPPTGPFPGAAWPPALPGYHPIGAVPAGYGYPPLPAYPPAAAFPPGIAYPPVPPGPGAPGFLPPGQPVPPGYLICPDPAAHLTPAAAPGAPEAAPSAPEAMPDAPGSASDESGSAGASTVPPGMPGESSGTTGR